MNMREKTKTNWVFDSEQKRTKESEREREMTRRENGIDFVWKIIFYVCFHAYIVNRLILMVISVSFINNSHEMFDLVLTCKQNGKIQNTKRKTHTNTHFTLPFCVCIFFSSHFSSSVHHFYAISIRFIKFKTHIKASEKHNKRIEAR